MPETPILTTKLLVPPLRLDLLIRERLIEQLNIGGQHPLTLVSAPAGYGKTTLVSSWLHETQMPSAWLSLDEDDNDPIRFLQYFIAALQGMIASPGGDLVIGSQGGKTVSFNTILKPLINEISRHTCPFVLVLDDFHIISSQTILDMITSLLERMPPPMHIVLLTRADPQLPLARLRARNQLVEIRAEQMRFTREEIAVFLNDIMRLELSAGDLTAMETRTEGWIAGLQLAALSMKGGGDLHAFVTAFAGSHHYIMDYLVEEVLAAQTETIRVFLLQTSILNRMCASLCNAVVDPNDREESDSQEILEAIEQKNLFIFPLDGERSWYRYHHLFADMLNRRVQRLFPHRLTELHLRAAKWYEQNGWIPDAIRHSLAAGMQDRAIQLIEQNGCLLLIRGEVCTLQRWIEAIEPYVQSRPWLCIFKAWISALTGYPDRVEDLFQYAERLISFPQTTTEFRLMQGTIAAGRAYLANLQGETRQAVIFANQALEYLPDIDLVSRSLRTVATSLLGDASSINGDLEQAYWAYKEAKQIGLNAGDNHLVIVANSNLANILFEQGLLHQAAEIYTETLEMTTRPDGQKTVLAGRALVEMSQVFYEWNDLEQAYMYVQQSLMLCQQWGNIDLQAMCLVMQARLELARHHLENVPDPLHAAERLMNEHQLLPRNAIWVKYALARSWISIGDMGKASDLIQKSGLTADDEIADLDEPKYLILLRLFLAEGDRDAALSLAQKLLHRAQAANRRGRIIEVLVLQALILQSMKNTGHALSTLERALTFARSEKFIRAFLDEGEPMTMLLRQAKARGVNTDYVSELLSQIQVPRDDVPVQSKGIRERLSRRELEVLKLIQAGCSNQEIAERLFISIATVKRHISNIYTKLDTQSRTQAVAIGKELGLLL